MCVGMGEVELRASKHGCLGELARMGVTKRKEGLSDSMVVHEWIGENIKGRGRGV